MTLLLYPYCLMFCSPSGVLRLARRGAVNHVLRRSQLDVTQAFEERLRVPFGLIGNLVLHSPQLFQNFILHPIFLPSILPACISPGRRTRELRTPSGSAASPRHCRYGDNSTSQGSPCGVLPRWLHVSHRPARHSAERRQSSCGCIRIAAGGFVQNQRRNELVKPMAMMVPPFASHLLVRRRQQGWRWSRSQIADDRCLYVYRCHVKNLPE